MNGHQWTGSKHSPNFITLTFNSRYVLNKPARKGFRLRFNAIKPNGKSYPVLLLPNLYDQKKRSRQSTLLSVSILNDEAIRFTMFKLGIKQITQTGTLCYTLSPSLIVNLLEAW